MNKQNRDNALILNNLLSTETYSMSRYQRNDAWEKSKIDTKNTNYQDENYSSNWNTIQMKKQKQQMNKGVRNFMSLFPNICFFVGCFCYSILLAQSPFPKEQFKEIHVNKLNSGYEAPNAKNGVLLSAKQQEKLAEAMLNFEGYRDEPNSCFLPEIGFYFYQEGDTAALALLFSERCNAIALTRSNSDTSIMGISDKAKGFIFDIVSETLWNLKPVLPEGTDTLFYEVGFEETFDYVADTFQTSVEVICEINYIKPEWGLNDGRVLWIYPNVKELKYPPIIYVQDEYINVRNERFVLHTVQPKETLFSIAKTYKVSSESLIKLNKIKNVRLQTGQRVIIPKE